MVQTITRRGMSLEDFLQRQQDGPFEIIDGEIVPMSPNVSGHSYLVRLLFRAIDNSLAGNAMCEVYAETAFVNPDTDNPNWVEDALEPHVMLLRRSDVAAFTSATPDWRERPFRIIPALVIEVISPTDRYTILLRKVAQYLDLGVQIILLINPRRKNVSIFRLGSDQLDVLGADQILTIDDLLPGFSISVKKLFE